MAKITIHPIGAAPFEIEAATIEIDGIRLSVEYLARLGDHPERTMAIKKEAGFLICKIDRQMTEQEQREFWNA